MPSAQNQPRKTPASTLDNVVSLLQRLQQYFTEHAIEAYLVGGCLRDLLLGYPIQDLDLAIRGDGPTIARALADLLKGSFALLGAEKGVGRVIFSKSAAALPVIDIASLHGDTILNDLHTRDFTINALALPLQDVSALAAPQAGPQLLQTGEAAPPLPFIDPFDGWRDLRTKTLRAVQSTIFQADPLRMMRAIRLSQSRQLHLAPETTQLIQREAGLLSQVASERIRDELLQMLALPGCVTALKALEHHHLLPMIFPALSSSTDSLTTNTTQGQTEPARERSHLDLNATTTMAHFIEALQEEIESAPEVRSVGQETQALLLHIMKSRGAREDWLASVVGAYPRSTLLLLASLLADLLSANNLPASSSRDEHDFWPLLDRPDGIIKALHRLTIGQQATAFIVALLQHAHVPWNLEPPPTDATIPWKAARHYFQRLGKYGVDIALFSLIYQIAHLNRATLAAQWQERAKTTLQLLERYYHQHGQLLPPPLIDGQTVMNHFGLASGPQIGKFLAEVRNAQLDGLLRTAEDALQFVANLIAQN